jgi:putative transposase
VSSLSYKSSYRRRLPHHQPPGATLFVTFRLAGSIPKSVQQSLVRKEQHGGGALAGISGAEKRARQTYAQMKRSFARWDDALDRAEGGALWLGHADVARLVADTLHSRDGREYDLLAFCIMPNHVHAIFAPLCRDDGAYHSLSSIMHSLKGRTARQANLVLGRRGAFWQHENYDHVVRDEAELGRIIAYVLENPVKAGLAQTRDEWEWSYSKYEL